MGVQKWRIYISFFPKNLALSDFAHYGTINRVFHKDFSYGGDFGYIFVWGDGGGQNVVKLYPYAV